MPPLETPPLARGRPLTTNVGATDTEKHPRLRGEDSLEGSVCIFRSETPPLTRGRRRGDALLNDLLRNTPACAGKTLNHCRRLHGIGKHPRLRGEDQRHRSAPTEAQETPPLARGRLCYAKRRHQNVGNPPACAGKTLTFGTVSLTMQETPPLARGRPGITMAARSFSGNTPACAGKTSIFLPLNFLVRKHPRLRGEDTNYGAGDGSTTETPPLARGRLRVSEREKNRSGNTPACAGKTHSGGSHGRLRQKHPRLRGEDTSILSTVSWLTETPPLARGRPRR